MLYQKGRKLKRSTRSRSRSFETKHMVRANSSTKKKKKHQKNVCRGGVVEGMGKVALKGKKWTKINLSEERRWWSENFAGEAVQGPW